VTLLHSSVKPALNPKGMKSRALLSAAELCYDVTNPPKLPRWREAESRDIG